MEVEKEYEEILLDLERAIVSVEREEPSFADLHVVSALEALADKYVAEKVKREPRKWQLLPVEQKLFDRLVEVSELRTGRVKVFEKKGWFRKEEKAIRTITPDELLLCIKRIRKSIDRWGRGGNRRGYIDFVRKYVV